MALLELAAVEHKLEGIVLDVVPALPHEPLRVMRFVQELADPPRPADGHPEYHTRI